MCGIFGWWAKEEVLPPLQRAVVAAILASENLSRGRDSWGLYRPDTDMLTKGVGSVLDEGTMVLAESPLAMAHTRSATSGKVTAENAHPFDFGTIVGAHNGMVNNHLALNTEYGRTFDVDSMHIFAHMADRLPLDEINAWGAVEYYRRDRRRLYLATFGGQLAVFGLGERGQPCQGLIWSSSEYAVERAVKAAGIKHYYPFDVQDGLIHYIKDFMLYSAGPVGIERRGESVIVRGRVRYAYQGQCGTRQVGAVVNNEYVSTSQHAHTCVCRECWPDLWEKSLEDRNALLASGATRPPHSQAAVIPIVPKGNGDARKHNGGAPWVDRLPNESRKRFRKRRREIIEAWEADQMLNGNHPEDDGDEMVATVVQEAVAALKDRRIEDGLVIIGREVDPCV